MHDLVSKFKSFFGDFFPSVMLGIKIIITIIIALLVVKIGSYIIKKIFQKQKKLKYRMDIRKLDTLSTLFVSIFRYSVYIITIITILADLNIVNTGSVIAAAGIGGIVLGFGAQSLIKDIVSGFFIVMEDQYVIGDLITIEDLTGKVEEMELRITKLRNFNGDLHIIPNGEIKKITNHSRGNKAVIVDIPIPYGTDVNKAFEAAAKVCKKMPEKLEGFIEYPQVMGVTEFGKENMTIRIIARTHPDGHWEAERIIRKAIKEEFEQQGLGLGNKG